MRLTSNIKDTALNVLLIAKKKIDTANRFTVRFTRRG